MFPGSPNAVLTLLKIKNKSDKIGNKSNVITSSKDVVGIKRSISQSEYQTSVQMKISYELKIIIQCFLYDGSKYAKLDNCLYKIERTYINGQFIELYLVSSDIEVNDNGN